MDRTLSGRTIGLLAGLVVLAGGAVWVDAATWHRDEVSAVGVCQEIATGRRVPDQQCAIPGAPVRWVYYRAGDTAPGMGGSIGGGSPVPPAPGTGKVITGGEPEQGGEVSNEPGGGSGSRGGGSSGGEGGEGGEEGSSGSGAGSGGGGGEE